MNSEQDIVAQQPVSDSRAEAASGAPAGPAIVRPGVLAPLLAAVLCTAFTVLTWQVFVTTARGQLVEEAALVGSTSAREAWSGVTELLLVVSVPLLALVVVAAVLVSLIRRRWSVAIATIVVLCGANLTTQILQETLNRPEIDASSITANSFPSGHATIAASITAAALLVAPVRWRPATALLGALLTTALGVSTMIGTGQLAWHRASDVVAAVLVTAAWYFLAEAVLAGLSRTRVDPAQRAAGRRRIRVPLRILYGVGTLCTGLGGGALLATAVRAPITTDLGHEIAFLGSALGVSAVVCFTVALMLRLRPHHHSPVMAQSH